MTADIVLPDLHTVVLVHGCFWHGCRKHYVAPSNNATFWSDKLLANKRRDQRQIRRIREAGWRAVTVWEHSLGTPNQANRTARRIFVTSGKARPR